jgi:hypothetical protein
VGASEACCVCEKFRPEHLATPGWMAIDTFSLTGVDRSWFCPNCVLIFAAKPFDHLPESFGEFIRGRRKQHRQ